jgi:hypothetical protein
MAVPRRAVSLLVTLRDLYLRQASTTRHRYDTTVETGRHDNVLHGVNYSVGEVHPPHDFDKRAR